MTTILSLDLGTKTGWALFQKKKNSNPSGNITSGTVNFVNDRYQGGGMRYLNFQKWLDTLKGNVGKIDEVYFEEVRRHLGVDAAHVYGGFLATLTSWCETRKIPYQGVPVQTIKKFIVGKGNANKQDVIEKVSSMGYNPQDDNEADAIALLLYKTTQ